MPTTMERYVFFNNAASHDALRAASAVATRCGARVVSVLAKAILIDVDPHRVPDIAAGLTDWQFTPERRKERERRLTPARRAERPVHQGSPT
jgi:hypothetical protein